MYSLFAEMSTRAAIMREEAMETGEILSFHGNMRKQGEFNYPKLNAKETGQGFDFAWVFYPTGQVIVYFRYLNDDDKFNDMTEDVIKWSAMRKPKEQIAEVAFG